MVVPTRCVGVVTRARGLFDARPHRKVITRCLVSAETPDAVSKPARDIAFNQHITAKCRALRQRGSHCAQCSPRARHDQFMQKHVEHATRVQVAMQMSIKACEYDRAECKTEVQDVAVP